jgi:xylulokinase
LRFRQKNQAAYEATSRISLVSSFLASVLMGSIAPIDVGDVGGMNLWDIHSRRWDEKLMSLVAGGPAKLTGLKTKLGSVVLDGGIRLGNISDYFVSRYGFSSTCQIVPFTGDNLATILALPLRASDAIVSLGTSTTFLMSTPNYKPDASYHFMNHPTTKGLYMFMLCYKNGALARELIRDRVNGESKSNSWDRFNEAVASTPPLGQHDLTRDKMKLGLYFPLPELVPHVKKGTWRYFYDATTESLEVVKDEDERWRDTIIDAGRELGQGGAAIADARAILESQLLSLRLRSQNLLSASSSSATASPGSRNGANESSIQPKSTGPSGQSESVPRDGGQVGEGREDGEEAEGNSIPPADQPRRIYLVGGASANPIIAQVCADVLGGAEGVFRLEIGGNACSLGAAYKAAWGIERETIDGGDEKEGFEEFVGKRWDEDKFVQKICSGYRKGVWERYGSALRGFDLMERDVLKRE